MAESSYAVVWLSKREWLRVREEQPCIGFAEYPSGSGAEVYIQQIIPAKWVTDFAPEGRNTLVMIDPTGTIEPYHPPTTKQIYP